MARGLILPDGREPALYASMPSPPCRRANASAIWLRLLFSTQTKSIRIRFTHPGGKRCRCSVRASESAFPSSLSRSAGYSAPLVENDQLIDDVEPGLFQLPDRRDDVSWFHVA